MGSVSASNTKGSEFESCWTYKEFFGWIILFSDHDLVVSSTKYVRQSGRNKVGHRLRPAYIFPDTDYVRHRLTRIMSGRGRVRRKVCPAGLRFIPLTVPDPPEKLPFECQKIAKNLTFF